MLYGLLVLSTTFTLSQISPAYLTNTWEVADVDYYGDLVPRNATPGDRFQFVIRRDGRVIYESTARRGYSFRLEGEWEFFPREDLLVFYYNRRVIDDCGPRIDRRFRPVRATYFVERLNRDQLILRSQDGSRDFALLAVRDWRNRRRAW